MLLVFGCVQGSLSKKLSARGRIQHSIRSGKFSRDICVKPGAIAVRNATNLTASNLTAGDTYFRLINSRCGARNGLLVVKCFANYFEASKRFICEWGICR